MMRGGDARARHVFGKRRVTATVGRAHMTGDALPLEKYLHRFVGDAHIDEFANEAEGRGIPVTVDPRRDNLARRGTLPDGEGVGLVRQAF